MAIVTLRPPLRERAGGQREVRVAGTTVGDALRSLERAHPRLSGWLLDDQGHVRPNVAVFVGGERVTEERSVDDGDRIDVVGAVSGGADDEVEVLVGTKKGLFVLRGARGGALEVASRAFPGQAVEYAIRDPRSGTYLVSVTSGHFGPRVFLSDDPMAPEWEQAEGPRFPQGEDASVERIWVLTPGEEDGLVYAGVDPAALFESRDGGRTWALNRGLWDQPSRREWFPGLGGLMVHTICPWPGDPRRLLVGISAVGVWVTGDGGDTWEAWNEGLEPWYLPTSVRDQPLGRCIHHVERAPLRPERLFMQFHGGVYRSDDGGRAWISIADGLPSDFGFPLVVDPRDPDRAFVIPLNSDQDRVTAEGRVRVFETRDAGASWIARTEGLPQAAFLTVLRQAFDHDGRDPLGLYFGATSGEVFCSADAGATWSRVAADLAPVLSVRAVR